MYSIEAYLKDMLATVTPLLDQAIEAFNTMLIRANGLALIEDLEVLRWLEEREKPEVLKDLEASSMSVDELRKRLAALSGTRLPFK